MRRLLLITAAIVVLHSVNAIGDETLATALYTDALPAMTQSVAANPLINETVKQSMLIAAIIMAALYPLAIFIQNRQDPAPMWFALSCISVATYFFTDSGLIEQLILLPVDIQLLDIKTKVTFVTLGWACAALLMFYHYSFPVSIHRQWLTINNLLTVLCTVCVIIATSPFTQAIAMGFVSYWALQLCVSLWILIYATCNKEPYAKTMLVAFIPLLITACIQAINRDMIDTMANISMYCIVILIVIDSHIVARKFSHAFKLADKLSKNLKEEVLQQTATLNQKNKQLEQTKCALKSANETLKKLSITDGLTQLYNRRYFDEQLREEWRRSCRYNTYLSVLMIDIDYFKKVNDSAGHIAGDQVLKLVARLLKQHFKRAGELAARYGGEEFAVVLPNIDPYMALSIAENLRQTIEQHRFTYNNKEYYLTVSVGICTAVPTTHCSEQDVLEAADCALYEAKHNGRNRVATVPLLPASDSAAH